MLCRTGLVPQLLVVMAVVNFRKPSVNYIDLASPAVAIIPANCLGCALHGVAVLR
jgi:hypothetical protein